MVTAKKLHCGHLFHVHCLRSWLERQNICPTCRALVIPPENGLAGSGQQTSKYFGILDSWISTVYYVTDSLCVHLPCWVRTTSFFNLIIQTIWLKIFPSYPIIIWSRDLCTLENIFTTNSELNSKGKLLLCSPFVIKFVDDTILDYMNYGERKVSAYYNHLEIALDWLFCLSYNHQD